MDAPGDLCLAFRRLAIVDRTPAADQPRRSETGILVFNGEIYNHRELRDEGGAKGMVYTSHGDAEVLLAALGLDGLTALDRLDGMFALAWIDLRRRKLVLARDRFGIKPLYWTRLAGGIAFASEIRALLALGAGKGAIDPQALHDYLTFGITDHRSQTFFHGIQQLPPGCTLKTSLDDPAAAEVTGWIPPHAGTHGGGNLGSLLQTSVQQHLAADVSTALALSGGLDSSALVGLARQALGPHAPITVLSYHAGTPPWDESSWADDVATACGATVIPVTVSATDLARDLDDLILTQGEPFGSTSIYAQYAIYRAAHQAGIPVVLDGQGADECFAGYVPALAARLAGALNDRSPGAVWALAQELGRGRGLSPLGLILRALRLRHPGRRTARLPWLNHRWFAGQGVDSSPPSLESAQGTPLRRMLDRAVALDSLPMLLRYADRNAMRWSVENRVPFLTKALHGFARGLDDAALIDDTGMTKAALRQAVAGVIPEHVRLRRDKIGFATPETQLLTSLAPTLLNWLDSTRPDAVPYLNLKQIRDTAKCGLLQGRPPAYLWRVVNLLRWRELHGLD